jgi:hypothetical protein
MGGFMEWTGHSTASHGASLLTLYTGDTNGILHAANANSGLQQPSGVWLCNELEKGLKLSLELHLVRFLILFYVIVLYCFVYFLHLQSPSDTITRIRVCMYEQALLGNLCRVAGSRSIVYATPGLVDLLADFSADIVSSSGGAYNGSTLEGLLSTMLSLLLLLAPMVHTDKLGADSTDGNWRALYEVLWFKEELASLAQGGQPGVQAVSLSTLSLSTSTNKTIAARLLMSTLLSAAFCSDLVCVDKVWYSDSVIG